MAPVRILLMLPIFGLAWACAEQPAVYRQQIAGCDDDVHRVEQMRSVSGHDDDTTPRRRADAVALAEYFLEHCFPNEFDSPTESTPASGTVAEIIAYQRKVHNRKYPKNRI